jgi:hypothetical protein
LVPVDFEDDDEFWLLREMFDVEADAEPPPLATFPLSFGDPGLSVPMLPAGSWGDGGIG